MLKKYLYLFVCLLLYPALAQSQWRILTPNLLKGHFTSSTLTYSDGCIFASNGSDSRFWISSDTGKTWTERTIPGPVYTIDFFNRQKGLVVCRPIYFNGIPNAFYTLDQGITWIPIGNNFTPGANFYSGIFDKSGNVIILHGGSIINNGFHGLYRTSDMGVTWDTIPGNQGTLIAPTISRSGKISFFTDPNKMYAGFRGASISTSQDVGKTWALQPGVFGYGSFSIAADKCDDNTIYIANEGFIPGITSNIFVTTDGGKSFQVTISHPVPYFSGSVAVSRNAVYCPTMADSGVIRSTDHGQTWKSIGGPPSQAYTREICAINDNTIILADSGGNIWITENSGGDPVSSLNSSNYTFPTIASCDSLSITIKVSAKTCDSVIVTNASITTAAVSSFTLLPPALPATLVGGGTMNFILRFDPQHVANNFSGTLDLEGVTLDCKTTLKIPFSATSIAEEPTLSVSDTVLKFGTFASCYRDTTVTLTNSGCDTLMILSGPGLLPPEYSLLTKWQFPIALAPGSSISVQFRLYPTTQGTFTATPVFTVSEHNMQKNVSFSLSGSSQKKLIILQADPPSIAFTKLSTCLPPHDTTITLVNKGCDSISILQGPGTLALEFTLLTPLTLPIILAPDSAITLTFRFSPATTGLFLTTAIFTASQKGFTQNVSINLSGEGLKGVGVLSYSPKSFNFKSLSICSHDSASGFITNTGCDSLLLDPSGVFGDPDYRVSGVGLRVSMAPADTIRYSVYLNPAQKGLRKGFLVLTSHLSGSTRRDSIPFSTTVTDGTRILSIPTSPLDFGTQSLCDPQRDTLITLSNTGCDTLILSALNGLGLGFGSNTNFPDTILPNTIKQIHIFTLLDTAGGKLTTSGTLNFTSNSDNTLAPITLSHSFIAGVRHDAGLFLDPAAKAGGDLSTVTYNIKETPGKTFSGAGIAKLNFDLNYNTDVLNYTSSKSTANLSSLDGKNFILIGNPNITADANGILATIGFTVYLTKDSTTSIILTNRNDTTQTPCGMTTLTLGGSATFDYSYLCGERSLSAFLRDGLQIHITSIRPNPAQDEIEINLQSGLKQDANVEIFNALGARVYFGAKNLILGENKVHLDTKGLSSGMYLVRVGSVSESLVISR